MALDAKTLRTHLEHCQRNRAQQAYRVTQLREQLEQAETTLAKWDGAIESTQVLLEQVEQEEPEPSTEPSTEPDDQ